MVDVIRSKAPAPEKPSPLSRRPASVLCHVVGPVPCLLVAAGCDRDPRRPPTGLRPPQPHMSADGFPKSLLGNAILSSALLRYQAHCNMPGHGAPVCRALQEGGPEHRPDDT